MDFTLAQQAEWEALAVFLFLSLICSGFIITSLYIYIFL